MDDKTKEKLAALKESKSYYDALQVYRTKLTRTMRSKEMEQAKAVFKDAIQFFVEEKQTTNLVDISDQFVDTLNKNQITPDNSIYQLLSEAANLLMIESVNNRDNKLLETARARFVDNCIKWSKLKAVLPIEKKLGHTALHDFFAYQYVKSNFAEAARNHLLLSNNVELFAAYLYRLCKKRGFKDEVDLFVVLPILQLLVMDRYPFASDLLVQYTREAQLGSYPYEKPLLNFVHILLHNVILTKDAKKFHALVQAYRPHIDRDATYSHYLETVGKLYLGVKQKSSGGSPFNFREMFKGLLDSETKEELATSHLPFLVNLEQDEDGYTTAEDGETQNTEKPKRTEPISVDDDDLD